MPAGQEICCGAQEVALKSHIAKIKIDQNRKTRLQILDMWCKIVREKCRDSKKIFCMMSFFVDPG